MSGNADAAYGRGVAYSTGPAAATIDPIKAHTWFNLAAAWGHDGAATARSEVADYMTAREVATAQRTTSEALTLGERHVA